MRASVEERLGDVVAGAEFRYQLQGRGREGGWRAYESSQLEHLGIALPTEMPARLLLPPVAKSFISDHISPSCAFISSPPQIFTPSELVSLASLYALVLLLK